jgi:hypothetical protein
MNYTTANPLTETMLLHSALNTTNIDMLSINAKTPKDTDSALP